MSQKYIHHATGVFKVDYQSAGFPDLLKIAQEWSSDENFFELIVRGVSEKNFGIQFVYISKPGEFDSLDAHPIKKYKDELKEKFGTGFYAWDYESGKGDEEGFNNRKNIVLLKSYSPKA